MNSKKKILIVDDERMHLDIMVELLGADYQTLVAKSGDKAIELARSELPDLILLDILLPNMSGYSVCQKLKAASQTKDIPVLFLTVKSDIKDEAKGFELGGVDYITKPFSPPIVRARVKTHLDLSQAIKLLSKKNSILESLVQERDAEIQQRERTEQELLATHQILEKAMHSAESANQSKSRFISSLSHEFRTPLNAVIGLSDILLDSPEIRGNNKTMLQNILDSGTHLSDLTSDLLDLAQLDSGHLDINYKTTSINNIIDECLSLISPTAQKNDITLNNFTKRITQYDAYVDPVRLKQVILNLLSNAVKYNVPKGCVNVELEHTGENSLKCTISDNGVGMNDQQVKRLFQFFDRAGAEDTHIEGTGIGLALSKNLIEAMGGRMGVYSEKGVGTSFWFVLPLAKDSSHCTECNQSG